MAKRYEADVDVDGSAHTTGDGVKSWAEESLVENYPASFCRAFACATSV
jgi:hypothetical protein